jgi:hypothetical protein
VVEGAQLGLQQVVQPLLVGAYLRVCGVGGVGQGEFGSASGGPLQESVCRQIWSKARAAAFDEVQVASPLARRPYDLRHAAASLWLNAGVPATEVAQRLGHSVSVLLKVYANCIDGQEGSVNARVLAALGDQGSRERLAAADSAPGPSDEDGSCGPVADQGE